MPLVFTSPRVRGEVVRRRRAGEGDYPQRALLLTRLGPSVLATLSRRAGRGLCRWALLLLTLYGTASAAGNVAAGRQKATACQTCHGLDGLSKMPDAPNIAGDPEEYLARQLTAFKKGERKNEMMSIVVQPLSDQDVADLAAYYAAIEVTAKVPTR
jgi:cytochrome c553